MSVATPFGLLVKMPSTPAPQRLVKHHWDTREGHDSLSTTTLPAHVSERKPERTEFIHGTVSRLKFPD